MALKQLLASVFSSVSSKELEPPTLRTVSFEAIVTEFGKNSKEDRELDDKLREAISLANSNRWDQAAKIFRDVQERLPDYDVPYLWLADFVKQNEGAAKAVTMLRHAAKRCRRKNELLQEAAELSLLKCDDLSGAIVLFIQALSAAEAKPSRGDVTLQRVCLFMKEIFLCLGDQTGADWADSLQHYTELDHSLIGKIQIAVKTASMEEQSHMGRQLREIHQHLRRMLS